MALAKTTQAKAWSHLPGWQSPGGTKRALLGGYFSVQDTRVMSLWKLGHPPHSSANGRLPALLGCSLGPCLEINVGWVRKQRFEGQKRVQENVSEASFESWRLRRGLKELKEESSGLLACRLRVQKPGGDSVSLGRDLRRAPGAAGVVED